MRLIDADAMEECIRKRYCEDCKVNKRDYDGVRCRACAAGDMLDDIADMPTVDPVQHGHWIIGDFHKSDGVYPEQAKKCSHCFRTGHITVVPWDALYCPWCGTKMDE